MNVLIDRDGHELFAQDLDEGRILENRRTVGDAVVSDARERMPGPTKHVDRLVLLGRLRTSFKDGEMPGDGLPGFLGGGQVAVELGEIGMVARMNARQCENKQDCNLDNGLLDKHKSFLNKLPQ